MRRTEYSSWRRRTYAWDFARESARAIVRDMSDLGERSCAEGRLVMLPLPCDIALHPDEEPLLSRGAAPSWRNGFLGGRAALRRALAHYAVPNLPILKNHRGAPVLPSGFVGSISHKSAIAVALASPEDGYTRGIDIEERKAPRENIAPRILRDEELALYASLPPAEAAAYLIRVFSIKEAVYKAIDPFLQRYVDYRECRLTFAPMDAVRVDLLLATDEPTIECHARWFEEAGYTVSVARARPLAHAQDSKGD